MSNQPLIFDHAIKFPNGLYYTGRTNNAARPDYWQGPKHEAVTYTEKGAYHKRDAFDCFANCTVERLLCRAASLITNPRT